MFLAPRQRKTTVFTRFWASASIYSVLWPGPSKNTGIYAVSCMLSGDFFGCQRHKNIVNYTIFTRGQYQKNRKIDQKSTKKRPTRTPKTHLQILPSFFPPRTPKNVKTPAGWRILGEGRRQGRAPRVAKAMLSCHHYTARHRRIYWSCPATPTKGGRRHQGASPFYYI